jgi:hypothetical protein
VLHCPITLVLLCGTLCRIRCTKSLFPAVRINYGEALQGGNWCDLEGMDSTYRLESDGGQTQTISRSTDPLLSEPFRRTLWLLLLGRQHRNGMRFVRLVSHAWVRKRRIIHEHLAKFCVAERVDDPLLSASADEQCTFA